MSEWELAAAVGLHLTVLWQIEDTGEIGPLTLSQVLAIERRLGIALLEPRAEPDSLADAARDDAKEIGSFVQATQTDGTSTRDDLCIALGWKHDRMTKALETLERQLFECGLHLYTDPVGFMSITALPLQRLSIAVLPAGECEFDMSDDELEIVLDFADLQSQRARRRLEDFAYEDRDRIGRLIALGVLEQAKGGIALSSVTADGLEPLRGDARPYVGWSRRPIQPKTTRTA